MIAGLNSLAHDIHVWAVGKGFYDHEVIPPTTMPGHGDRTPNPSLPGEKIALMHSELSEMLEALRDDNRGDEAEELCDLLIRALDYAGWRGIDVEAGIHAKMKVNLDRPYLHGRKF